jgi:aminoglycoside phosphotransferase (APT) family kinase protein
MATELSMPMDVDTAVPAARLGPWLAAQVSRAHAEVQVEQLAGGSSNLTSRVRDRVRIARNVADGERTRAADQD